MNTRLRQLINTSIENFEGDPWLGTSLMSNLKIIDYQLVNQQPTNSNKSVAMLVKHIISWKVFVVRKLQGDQLFDIEINSTQDWPAISINNQAEWNTQLRRAIKARYTR